MIKEVKEDTDKDENIKKEKEENGSTKTKIRRFKS